MRSFILQSECQKKNFWKVGAPSFGAGTVHNSIHYCTENNSKQCCVNGFGPNKNFRYFKVRAAQGIIVFVKS